MREYLVWLLDSKQQGRQLSVGTVRKHLATVKVLFASAVIDEAISHSPAVHVRVPTPEAKPDAKRAKWMEAEQLAAVLDALDPEWRLFFELLTGVHAPRLCPRARRRLGQRRLPGHGAVGNKWATGATRTTANRPSASAQETPD